LERKNGEFLEANKICILITSTINPGDFPFVGRKGKEFREDEYFEAVLFYSQFNLPLVFIDNSLFLSERILKEISRNPYSEYLKFESKESHLGKGHGELEIIKYGLANSKLLNSCEKVIKISGRFIVSNIDAFIQNLNSSGSIHFCNYSRNLNWADTRILMMNKDFLITYFVPTMETYLDESNNEFFEKTYARAIHLFQHHGGRISLWSVYPSYKGINGHNGKNVSFNWYKRFKYQLYFKLKKFIFNQTV
jgi:hypothetical protein